MADYREHERSGIPFERRVAEVYRSLGFRVTHNVQLPGKQIDLLARRDVRAAPDAILAIECKARSSEPVGNEDVLKFCGSLGIDVVKVMVSTARAGGAA